MWKLGWGWGWGYLLYLISNIVLYNKKLWNMHQLSIFLSLLVILRVVIFIVLIIFLFAILLVVRLLFPIYGQARDMGEESEPQQRTM